MNVLLAISDRFFGDAIVRFATSHNWPADTQFKLISVITPVANQPGRTIIEKESFFEEDKTQADKLLSQEKANLLKRLPGASVECAVRIGHAANEILACAQTWPASLIVIGSHGRQGLERIFLGSVSFHVASHAPCSLSIVRNAEVDMLNFEMEESDIPDEMKTYVEV